MADKEAELREELDELELDEADEDAWDSLVEILDRWPKNPERLSAIVAELAPTLETWDEDVRRMAPAAWALAALQNATFGAPLMALANGLDLSGSEIEPKQVNALCKRPEFAHLLYLNLSDNPIQSKGAKCLARSKTLTQLRALELTESQIGDEGAAALAASANLASLQELDLSDARLTTQGLKAFRRSEHLPEHLKDEIDGWEGDPSQGRTSSSSDDEDYDEDWE